MWLLSLSDSGTYELTEFSDDGPVPPYAILSHTWLQNAAAEPTFKDLREGSGQEKPGYEKIRFCGDQAGRNGLRYYWVDTCCINKENYSELSCAIRSMFRWYRKADRCYVYLSDVHSSGDVAVSRSWDSEFYKSRWFTRGWALQELLAPRSVEFFSSEYVRLGDKNALGQQICEITGVPILALQGTLLSQFSREERFKWSSSRQTSVPEDMAYSLIGIFDIEMPIIYGEGVGDALRRLQEAIERREKCIRDMRLGDPRYNKKLIEENKGGLLKDVYCWILENPQFQQWLSDEQCSILWIRGNPGKGKTMLLCGIINELQKSGSSVTISTYFFCQATDRRADNATAVLRGLMFTLVCQWPSLVSYVQAEYDTAGKDLFEAGNAWVALARILTSMLGDPILDGACVIIDALDECVEGQSVLLNFIVNASSTYSRIKWIVSSRNWPSIEKEIDRVVQAVRLSLDLNEASISAAVTAYTHIKVRELAKRNNYNHDERDTVQRNLENSSDGTFLWVALVCQELLDDAGWEARETSKQFPPGLEPLYHRMIKQISLSKRSKICKKVLAIASVVRRPLTLREMSSFVSEGPPLSSGNELWVDIVQSCGSFLSLRENIVSFVHQSAKDFLVGQAHRDIYPSGVEHVHHVVFTQSMSLMFETLHRDMYKLQDMGASIAQVRPPPFYDPLGAISYSCIYWIEHLQESSVMRNSVIRHNRELIDNFLRKYYLFWLEASSLCRSLSAAQVSMVKLENLVQQEASAETLQLRELVYDARRFIMYHKTAIERFPLQTYVSALLFSPNRSLIRQLYIHEEPSSLTILPPVADQWSACLQTLEGKSGLVVSVAFSHDSTRLASGSENGTVKIWDVSSGACLQTLEGHSRWLTSVMFSHDSMRLASGSEDCTIKIWDTSSGSGSGACLQKFEGHNKWVTSVAFSHDSMRLASGSGDCTVKIWDTDSDSGSGACLQTLEGHNKRVMSVAFSHDSMRLASGSGDCTVKIWDISSSDSACVQTIRGHSDDVRSVVFSHDSLRLASGSGDYTVKIWDVSSSNGACLQTIEGHSDIIESIVFSHDSTRLASGSGDCTVKIWDVGSGACLQTIEGHIHTVHSVAFSHDSTQLASGSRDRTVKIWDVDSGTYPQMTESPGYTVFWVAFSPDSTRLASGSDDCTIKIWDVGTGTCLRTLEGNGETVGIATFSHDSMQLASRSGHRTVKIWDVGNSTCLRTLDDCSYKTWTLAFSHDSTKLATGSDDGKIKIWDLCSSACLQTIESYSFIVRSVVFSHDSTQLASGSEDGKIKIWEACSGTCLQTLEVDSNVCSIAFSDDSMRLASLLGDRTVKIWDVGSGKCLHTLEGYTGFDTSPHTFEQLTTQANEAQHLQYISGKSTTDEAWIEYKSIKLWLPSEYRRLCSAKLADTMAIGTTAGKVWMCRFNTTD